MRKIIQSMCYKCNGAGIWTKNSPQGDIVYDPCPVCLGDKYLDIKYISLPNGLFYSYEVYESIDHNEYVGLSSPGDQYCNMITSCGLIDLSEGSRARGVLWRLFDVQSITRQNLVTLIG